MSRDRGPLDIGDVAEEHALPAGDFAVWLHRTRRAQEADDSVGVPCGECNACCRASYFIQVRPEEKQTLSRIPQQLLFPAPGLPEGNVVLGFDEKGRCPMLVAGRCSIYEQRPLTCRSYDCRVFPAAGIAPDECDKDPIRRHVRCWKFSYPTRNDRSLHAAARAAATFLRERAKCFPAGFVPSNSTQLAALAIKVCEVFLEDLREPAETDRRSRDLRVAKAVIETSERLDARREVERAAPLDDVDGGRDVD